MHNPLHSVLGRRRAVMPAPLPLPLLLLLLLLLPLLFCCPLQLWLVFQKDRRERC